MKATEIEVGGRYIVRVSKRLTVVEVLAIRSVYSGRRTGHGGRDRRVYDCRNLVTRRAIVVKSAQRFRAVADILVMEAILAGDASDIARILGKLTRETK